MNPSRKFVLKGKRTTDLRFRPLGLRTRNTLNGTLSDGIKTNGLYRCKHQVVDTYGGDQWKLVLCNRQSEAATGNAITVSAAIEYPVGVINQVLFNGATSVTIANGGPDVYSDALPFFMPAGAVFYTRIIVSVASAGMKWPIMDDMSFASANTEGATLGTGALPSITAAVTPANVTQVYVPVAILGRSFAPFAVGLIGDSIITGTGDTLSLVNWGFGARSLNGKVPMLSVSSAGECASKNGAAVRGFNDSHANRIALLAGCGVTHAIVAYGINDLAQGNSADQVKMGLQDIYNLLASYGIKAIPSKTGTFTTSTDSWITAANQTCQAYAVSGNKLDQVNTYLNTAANSSAPFDPFSTVLDRATNKWLTNGATTFLNTIDGEHPSVLGHTTMGAVIDPMTFGPAIVVPTSKTVAQVFAAAAADWNAESLSLSDGDLVSTWTDSVNSIAAVAASNQPTYKAANTPAGTPTVLFSTSGNTRLVATTVSAINNIWTNGGYMIAAFKIGAASVTNNRLFTKSTTVDIPASAQLRFQPTFSTTSPQMAVAAPAAGASAWVVMDVLYDPSKLTNVCRFRINGVYTYSPAGPTSVGTLSDDTANNMILGNNSTFIRAWDGDIARIAFWKTPPSQSEQDAVYAYLRAYTGI